MVMRMLVRTHFIATEKCANRHACHGDLPNRNEKSVYLFDRLMSMRTVNIIPVTRNSILFCFLIEILLTPKIVC